MFLFMLTVPLENFQLAKVPLSNPMFGGHCPPLWAKAPTQKKQAASAIIHAKTLKSPMKANAKTREGRGVMKSQKCCSANVRRDALNKCTYFVGNEG